MKLVFLSLFITPFLLFPAKAQETPDYNLYDERITILELAKCYEILKRKEQEIAMMEAWASALPVNVKNLSKKEFTTFFQEDDAVVRKKFQLLLSRPASNGEGNALFERCVELQTIVPPIIDKIQLINKIKGE